MEAYVYILYSASKNKLYVGCTKDINQRIQQHNAGRNLSTKFGVPWEIKHTESFVSLALARKREQEIKRMKSRKFIEQVIRGER